MKLKSKLLSMALAFVPVIGFADSNIKMVVGTYTDAGSQGLYSFSFDQSTGTASGITSLKVDNPSYFTFSKDGRNIYAVSEKNNATAVLNSIGYDPVNGTFAFKNSQLHMVPILVMLLQMARLRLQLTTLVVQSLCSQFLRMEHLVSLCFR